MGNDMKTLATKYEALKKRADELKRKQALIEGERKAYINKLKEAGFKTLQEAVDYVTQKQKEEVERTLVLKEKLDKYELAIASLEEKLGGMYGR